MTDIERPGARIVGQKAFTAADQQAFAAQSHDRNPMHVDPVAARRLISGRQVVHGVHTLIHALEFYRPAAPGSRMRVSCSFTHPVNVGDLVTYAQADAEDGAASIVASVDGLACTEVTLERPSTPDEPGPAVAAGPALRRVDGLARPLDENPAAEAGARFEIPAWPDSLAASFPQVAALLGKAGLSALARLSYFVGMVCPGLHSVFSSLQFTLGDATADRSLLEVRRYDPRFRLFIVGFDGPLRGELRAFLRPPPQPQPSAAAAAAQFEGHEYAGTRSLVVGGSRGLGELTAKIVAAGGGDVVVSHAAGRADADAVAAEINAGGRGRCRTCALDLRSPFAGIDGIDPAALDAVYYFATPRIYNKRIGLFDRSAFDEFVDFYLQRFHELCLWLERSGRRRPVHVYLPSTVFIEERPKGLAEYAMAKAAAEVLADELNRSLSHVVVLRSRLPRLATDQTSSILNLSAASNLDAMRSVVDQMSRAISSL